ncbi:MAG: 6-carboxytetrahydropterin synthase [Holophagales bacterium]|nr:6-carboxytetrahydropterin synthase [Holophagales bacterium]
MSPGSGTEGTSDSDIENASAGNAETGNVDTGKTGTVARAPSEGIFTLVLAKEDFKFAAAHFTLFGPEEAELLHGHNYHVAVELTGPSLDEEGMLASFVETKRAIRAACARLDDRTLVPRNSPHLEIRQVEDHVEVRFRDRCYRLPAGDVVMLDEINSSIEILARRLWRELVVKVDFSALDSLGVSVSETAGQSCWYRAPIPPSD